MFLLLFFFIEPETRVSTVVIFLFFATRCFLFGFFFVENKFDFFYSRILWTFVYSMALGCRAGRSGCYRVLPGFIGFTGFVVGFTGFYWVGSGFNMVISPFNRVLPGFTEFYRLLLGFTGFYRVLPGFTESYRV